MTIQECRAFAMQNPYCSLATVDGSRPRVRTIWLWAADDGGFYFETLAPKDMYRQLRENPNVELCFFNGARDAAAGQELRVSGTVEFTDDPRLKQRLFELEPMLKQVDDQDPKNGVVRIFRVASGEAWFWTIKDILKERQLEHVRFGAVGATAR